MAEPLEAGDSATWKYYACPICEANCGLRIKVDEAERQILRIEGDPDDVRSAGYVCPKSQAIKGISKILHVSGSH